MTNLKQKGPEARRYRRTRLKRAMNPILEIFGCTQMQAEANVRKMLKENVSLQIEIDGKTEELQLLRKDVESKGIEIQRLNLEIEAVHKASQDSIIEVQDKTNKLLHEAELKRLDLEAKLPPAS